MEEKNQTFASRCGQKFFNELFARVRADMSDEVLDIIADVMLHKLNSLAETDKLFVFNLIVQTLSCPHFQAMPYVAIRMACNNGCVMNQGQFYIHFVENGMFPPSEYQQCPKCGEMMPWTKCRRDRYIEACITIVEKAAKRDNDLSLSS